MRERSKALPGFLITIGLSSLLYLIMVSVQNSHVLREKIFSYQTLEDNAQIDLLFRFFWVLGDMNEAQFYKSIPGAIGLILFSLIAYILYKRKSRWAGFGISYNSGLWPWVLLASTIGLVISNILYIDHLTEGWIPTFVAFVSIPAGIVLLYGGGWKNTLTGSILGGFLAFPISWFVIRVILVPLELPSVIGNVTGMWVGAIIVFEICNYLPWMRLPEASQETDDAEVAATQEQEDSYKNNSIWFIRRLFADFTEPQFFANEIATIGLLLGVIVSWILNPFNPFYGSGLLPALLFGQFLTLSFGNFLYLDQWKKLGWYPTFVPAVSVVPAIIQTYDGGLLSIVGGAFVGALVAPPIAQLVNRRIPNHWHPVVGNTFSMAFSTFIIMEMIKVL